MANLAGLEPVLEDVFVKKAPKLPENGKKTIVRVAPILALILGVLTLLSVITLWHWAHIVNNYSSLLSQLCSASGTYTGCANTLPSRLTFWIWLSLLVLLAEAILYLAAYTGLRDRTKKGWNYLYYAAIINLVYAVVTLFSNYGSVGSFIGNLIGSALGFYLLFQIRSHYIGKKVAPHAALPKDPTRA